MGDAAIRIENLSKEYRLGTIGYGTLREDLQSWWARMRGKDDPNSLINVAHGSRSDKNHFLALDDLSFEVKKGDRLGVVGRNGAGKSTLLKILSRITSPSKGNIYIDGRIGSLLEVGTGFHPELTGRENVYLNGSIMGMKKWEIDKRFDEIVDFSGIERFIDTPIKRYSSGMFVRLGFAVAAHLEPEILIVDEVLAVGDAEFQKKAIGKMEDVSMNQGRTILFVSHNMVSVSSLCNKGLILEHGKLAYHYSNIDDVITRYMLPLDEKLLSEKWENQGDFKHKNFIPNRMYIEANGREASVITRKDHSVYLVVESEIKELNNHLNIGFNLEYETGEELFTSWLKDIRVETNLLVGINKFKVKIPNEILKPGTYKITLHAGLHEIAAIIDPANVMPQIKFTVGGSIGTAYGSDVRGGAIIPLLKWKTER